MMIDTSPWSFCSHWQPGHPGYPVPVIHLVLQGRVYHRFGIFEIVVKIVVRIVVKIVVKIVVRIVFKMVVKIVVLHIFAGPP